MSQDSQQRRAPAALFTQVDISATTQGPVIRRGSEDQSDLLREMLAAQDRTNELLEELVATTGALQKQRTTELHQWKKAHPELARACREAAEGLSQVQVEFLHRMTEEINDTVDDLREGDFMLNEFVDRFGPRMAHLNGVVQVLAQLSSAPNPTDTARP